MKQAILALSIILTVSGCAAPASITRNTSERDSYTIYQMGDCVSATFCSGEGIKDDITQEAIAYCEKQGLRFRLISAKAYPGGGAGTYVGQRATVKFRCLMKSDTPLSD